MMSSYKIIFLFIYVIVKIFYDQFDLDNNLMFCFFYIEIDDIFEVG